MMENLMLTQAEILFLENAELLPWPIKVPGWMSSLKDEVAIQGLQSLLIRDLALPRDDGKISLTSGLDVLIKRLSESPIVWDLRVELDGQLADSIIFGNSNEAEKVILAAKGRLGMMSFMETSADEVISLCAGVVETAITEESDNKRLAFSIYNLNNGNTFSGSLSSGKLEVGGEIISENPTVLDVLEAIRPGLQVLEDKEAD